MKSKRKSQSLRAVRCAWLGGWKHVDNQKPPFGKQILYWTGLVRELGPSGITTLMHTDAHGDLYSNVNANAVKWWMLLPELPPNTQQQETL